jgi:hypothetical protein
VVAGGTLNNGILRVLLPDFLKVRALWVDTCVADSLAAILKTVILLCVMVL